MKVGNLVKIVDRDIDSRGFIKGSWNKNYGVLEGKIVSFVYSNPIVKITKVRDGYLENLNKEFNINYSLVDVIKSNNKSYLPDYL